jgi:hypothetical protein
VQLQVWRAGDDVVFRPLPAVAFAFRVALGRVGKLDVTAEAALALGIAVDLIALFETCLKTKYSCPGHTRTRTK